MTKKEFEYYKTNIINHIQERLYNVKIDEQDRVFLHKLLILIDYYTYENRMNKKGLLSYAIVDGWKANDILGSEIITFDKSL